jgi:HEAT repeat protein
MSLIAALTDPNPEMRELALIHLSAKKEPSDEELRALADRLRDDSQRIRELAAETFGGAQFSWGVERVLRGLPAELLLPALADRSAKVRERTLWLLRYYPPNDSIRSAVMVLLADPICLVRVRAAAVLWEQARDLDALLPVVVAAVCSGDQDGVLFGCQLLMAFGPAAGDIVPLVWSYLRHPDGMVRANAAYALFKCCSDRRVLAEAAEQLEAGSADGLADAFIKFAAHQLRKAAKVEQGAADRPSE